MSTYVRILKSMSDKIRRDKIIACMDALNDSSHSNICENIKKDSIIKKAALERILDFLLNWYSVNGHYSDDTFKDSFVQVCSEIIENFMLKNLEHSREIDSSSINVVGRVITEYKFQVYSGGRSSFTDKVLKRIRHDFLKGNPLLGYELQSTFSSPNDMVWATWSKVSDNPFDFADFSPNDKYKYPVIKSCLGLVVTDDTRKIILLKYELPGVPKMLWYPTVAEASTYERFKPVIKEYNKKIPAHGETRLRFKDELKYLRSFYHTDYWNVVRLKPRPEAVHKGEHTQLAYCTNIKLGKAPEFLQPGQ